MGKSGGLNGTFVRCLPPGACVLTSKISTVVLVPPVWVRPDIAMMRPSPSEIVEAYQRPLAMFWDW